MIKSLYYAMVIIVIVIMLAGCSNSKQNEGIIYNINEVMDKSIGEYGDIYHIEVIDDGVILFYDNLTFYSINYAYIRYDDQEWGLSSVGRVDLNPKDGFNFKVSINNKYSLFYALGVITDPEVYSINTYMSNKEVQKPAKIVTTEEGIRLWIAIYEEYIEPPFHFIGINKDGEEVFFYGK